MSLPDPPPLPGNPSGRDDNIADDAVLARDAVLQGVSIVHPPVPVWGHAAVAAFVVLVVCGYVATAVAPTWANSNPEGLIALNSRIRHLLLVVGGGIPWWSYASIAGVRLALAFVVCHLIGRAYGDRVLEWFGRYLGMTRESIVTMQAGFDKVDWLIVPWFAGSNIVAVITGIRRMAPVRLAVLLTIGIAGRLAVYWYLGKAFEDEIDKVLDFIGRYQWPLTIVSIVLVVLSVSVNLRRGRNFKL
ncbi:MAG TPA: hypothetical protein VMM60_11490 [Ilumatobacter sp.]|nr:hypothetical protein [Ilumatobacter sp.]